MLLNTVIENLSFHIIILGIFAPQLYTKMFLRDELKSKINDLLKSKSTQVHTLCRPWGPKVPGSLDQGCQVDRSCKPKGN
jgi:hypothetical protein